MLITLTEWDAKTFSDPHSKTTLRAWARTGLIKPAPQKVGRQYMVDPQACYCNPIAQPVRDIEDPVVARIYRQ